MREQLVQADSLLMHILISLSDSGLLSWQHNVLFCILYGGELVNKSSNGLVVYRITTILS